MRQCPRAVATGIEGVLPLEVGGESGRGTSVTAHPCSFSPVVGPSTTVPCAAFVVVVVVVVEDVDGPPVVVLVVDEVGGREATASVPSVTSSTLATTASPSRSGQRREEPTLSLSLLLDKHTSRWARPPSGQFLTR